MSTQKMSTQKDSRGSEWRKWDLHLHCPGTKLADAFNLKEGSPWDAYCTALHASDVQAFGITDYFSVDGYEACLKEYRARFKISPKMFFPKKAKKRRQIIIVTHNPNLAVVADAEQIIHVSIDKKKDNDFDFASGSIENPVTNSLALDILEGTRPAFDNRRLKYRRNSAT